MINYYILNLDFCYMFTAQFFNNRVFLYNVAEKMHLFSYSNIYLILIKTTKNIFYNFIPNEPMFFSGWGFFYLQKLHVQYIKNMRSFGVLF